jgi:Dolichyl-phosphate-mannose-protein mannosyltransferase
VNYVSEKQRAMLLPALVATYVLVLAVLISLRTAPFIGFETDGVYYMMSARSLFTKAFVPSTFGGGIGMPLAIATANAIISDTFRSAQFVSAVAGLIYLIAAARIITRVYSPTVGIITGALLLVSPILLVNSTSSLTDVLGACLPLAGLALLLSNQSSPRWFVSLLTGVLFGAAYSVRPINFVFFPLPLIATASSAQRKQVIMAAVGLLLGVLPQLYVNQKYFGNPFYSDNWRNTAALVLDWDQVNRLSSFREVIQQAGPRLFVVWIKRLLVDLPIALYHVAYLPLLFSLPGFFLAFRKAKDPHRRVMFTWAACTLCYLVLVAGVWRIEARYFLPVLPLLLSAGVLMWQHLTERSKALFVGGLAVAILMSAAVTFRDGRELLKSQSTEFKEAGLFLQQQAAPGDVILASQPSVFFYSHRPGMLLGAVPQEEIDQLDTTVASRHIDWVVFDERRGYQDNPRLGWMLDPKSALAADRGWQPVFVLESPRLVVWRAPRT